MSVKYSESQDELMQFLLRSGKARAELQSLLSLGLHRLDFGLKNAISLETQKGDYDEY